MKKHRKAETINNLVNILFIKVFVILLFIMNLSAKKYKNYFNLKGKR